MLHALEVMVMILIAIYTIISIAGAVVNLKKSEELERRVKLLERKHAETRELTYKALWNSMEKGEKLEPMEEGESCGSISLEKLQN